jgi:cytochrome c oxidase accessory protein FixG
MAEVEDFNDESFRDSVSHISKEGKRVWFFPKKPHGKLYNARTLLTYFYLLVFFSVPFIKVHGGPLFMFNILERSYILFGVRFWPQDFFLFVLGMIIFIVFIALFTVVFGRVFCGWICPQTVFMEMVFRKIEYWIEGDQASQRALAKQAWDAEKIRKKGLKTAIFFIISVLVANTFYAYMIGVDALYKIITEPFELHVGGFLGMLVFSGVFFFVFSWFREQVCLVVCPYGRMQGVLLDKHSIVVAYDYKRGEPRHKYTKEPKPGLGDCIDCNECVRVCPTGIDIRHGTQLECTNCTACIDACDHIMDKVKQPKGLIRYASEANIAKGRKLKWTPRMVAYSIILVLLIGVETFLLATRSDLDTTIIRAKGVLYNTEVDGRISNLYNVKIINKTAEELDIQFVVDAPNAEVKMIGNDMHIAPNNLADGEFFIILPAEDIHTQKSKLKIQMVANGKVMDVEKTTFLAPVSH